MLTELQQPAYLHVVINHVPIMGSAMGLLALVVAAFLKSRTAFIPGLCILILSGIAAWPVYASGDAAYKPVRKVADEAGIDWLDTHMDRADQTIWTFYAMAGLAGAALLVPLRWPRTAFPLAIVAAASALVCAGAGAYVAEAGGRIRHSEFRPAEENH